MKRNQLPHVHIRQSIAIRHEESLSVNKIRYPRYAAPCARHIARECHGDAPARFLTGTGERYCIRSRGTKALPAGVVSEVLIDHFALVSGSDDEISDSTAGQV